MSTVSLCMIVRDEEKTLSRVLEAARQFCDELVVVDTGSTDRTVEIANACGAKVYHFKWIDDFAAARNFSFSKATGDWILWLDADDVLPPETIEIGKKMKAWLPQAPAPALFCPYEYAHNDLGQVTLMQSRERWVKRCAGFRWEGRIHETIQGAGEKFVHIPEFLVVHDTHKDNRVRKESRNLHIFESYLDIQTATTRELYLYGGELTNAHQYEKAITVYNRYLEIFPKDMYDLFEEPYIVRIGLITCYKALERRQEAAQAAANAIAYNPSRAEAYALFGVIMWELGQVPAAFPLFLAAAACKAPTHGGLVFQIYYSDHIRSMIEECKKILDNPATAG